MPRCGPAPRLPAGWRKGNETAGAKLPGRALLIIMGSLRGSTSSWESITQLLLHQQRADLMLVLASPMIALMTGNGTSGAAESARRFNEILGRHATHVVSVPERTDWGDALDLMEEEHEHDSKSTSVPLALLPWRKRTIGCPPMAWMPSPLGGVKSANCTTFRNVTRPLASTGSAAIVGVYRWYVKRALVERHLLRQYDWFIQTRTDMLLLCHLHLPSPGLLAPLLERNRSVALVPDGEDWGGLYERFLIATRGAILPAMTTVQAWVTGQSTLAGNPEMQLKGSLRSGCVFVMRIPRSGFVVQPIPTVSMRPSRTHSRQQRTHPEASERTYSPNREGEKGGAATFEGSRSNWGGCMHPASHEDAWHFGVPDRWVRFRPEVPAAMKQQHLCPKYSGSWWLTERTCNSSSAAYGGRTLA